MPREYFDWLAFQDRNIRNLQETHGVDRTKWPGYGSVMPYGGYPNLSMQEAPKDEPKSTDERGPR